MGISDFNKFISKFCNNANIYYPLSYFKGKKIAIDANNYLYSEWVSAYSKIVYITDVSMNEPDKNEVIKLWLNKSKIFIKRFLENGITPIFIFDGKYHIKKKETQNKRNEDKIKVREKIKEIRKNINDIDILERTTLMLDNLRKYMCRDTYPSNEEYEIMKTVLNSIGIPVIQALWESEQLCSILCRENKVDAVYSTDTDNMLYGCPILLTGFTKGMKNEKTNEIEIHFSSVILNKILESCKLSFESFVDLCIMFGCDYNKNIPKIGFNKAYTLIMEYKNIDKLPENYGKIKLDKTYLDHEWCRQWFSYKSSSTLYEDNINLDIDKNKLIECARDILEIYNIQDWLIDFSNLYSKFNQTNDRILMYKPPISNVKLIIKTDNKNDINSLVQQQLKLINKQ